MDTNGLNLAAFSQFLGRTSILKTASAVIISSKILEISKVFLDTMVFPILERDTDGDGESDLKKLERRKYSFGGATFEIGKFLIELIKFFFVLIVAFILSAASS